MEMYEYCSSSVDTKRPIVILLLVQTTPMLKRFTSWGLRLSRHSFNDSSKNINLLVDVDFFFAAWRELEACTVFMWCCGWALPRTPFRK